MLTPSTCPSDLAVLFSCMPVVSAAVAALCPPVWGGRSFWHGPGPCHLSGLLWSRESSSLYPWHERQGCARLVTAWPQRAGSQREAGLGAVVQ